MLNNSATTIIGLEQLVGNLSLDVDNDPFAVDDRVDAYRRHPRPQTGTPSSQAVHRPKTAHKGAWKPKVAGYSALMEWICERIRANKTGDGPFEMARKVSGFTEDQLWEIYGEWHNCRLHKLLLREVVEKPIDRRPPLQY